MKRVDERTLDFFEVPQAPAPVNGSLDCAAELCATLADMITDSINRKVIRSRYDLAARMSELTGHEITKAMIDAWTAESKEAWRFPFQFAPAMEAACDSTALQELFGRKRGSRILVGEDALLAEMGRLDVDEARIKQRRAKLKARLSRGLR